MIFFLTLALIGDVFYCNILFMLEASNCTTEISILKQKCIQPTSCMKSNKRAVKHRKKATKSTNKPLSICFLEVIHVCAKLWSICIIVIL